MNRRLGTYLTIGTILMSGFTKPSQSAAADSARADLSITIHIYNYAEVSPKMLLKAERVAAEVFRKAGVNIGWLNRNPSLKDNAERADEHEVLYPEIEVSILPRLMAERFVLPAG